MNERFMMRAAKYIDIIAVSCDSFDEETNVALGRGMSEVIPNVYETARLCQKYGVKFKLNTVISLYNAHEDFNKDIKALKPFRWKVFQVLIVKGENNSRKKTLRNARPCRINEEIFQDFCSRHSHHDCFVAESNDVMRSSYLILDEYMRFLNKGTEDATESILDVGVAKAMEGVYWDEEAFDERGGIYDWSSETKPEGCGSMNLDLEF